MRSALLISAIAVAGCSPGVDPPSPTRGGSAPAPAGAKPAASAGPPWFEEDAARSGLDFRHISGADPTTRLFLPEIVCGGVALLDYDGDGDLDVFLVQGGRVDAAPATQPPDRLYQNRGDGTFEDVTEAAHAGGEGYGIGCAANDYDGDGDIDIYVTNAGQNVLLRNDGGTFTLVPRAAGADDPSLSSSAAFFDYDRDHDLDLMVIDYISWSIDSDLRCYSPFGTLDYCLPNNYQAPMPSRLYRNDGGRFTDVSSATGIDRAAGNGLGVVTADFDGDGRLDIFVANDGTVNHHWFQTEDGRFEERAMRKGTAVNQAGRIQAGMGVAAIDLDGDDALELFVTNLRNETNTLFRNRGAYYEDATDRLGLGVSSLPYTGFGLGFHDFDHDGDLDLYIANGRVGQTSEARAQADPYAEPNLLYSNENGTFREVLPVGGTAAPVSFASRGAAFGDIDDDGDIDIVVANRDAPPSLLRNVASANRERHWAILDVRERSGAPAQHAKVRLTAGGKTWTRIVDPHSSYCSSNDPRVHLGLGPATEVESVVIRFADGTVETHGPLATDRIHKIVRGGAGER